jgi:hypothetical protein
MSREFYLFRTITTLLLCSYLRTCSRNRPSVDLVTRLTPIIRINPPSGGSADDLRPQKQPLVASGRRNNILER